MKIYKLSCLSTCGSYFASYLQSVTVLADSKVEALNKILDYCEHCGDHFIRKVTIDDIEELKEDRFGIIDEVSDSDY